MRANFYAQRLGGEQPMDPHKLRFINEVQHRVTRFIEQILIDDPARPPTKCCCGYYSRRAPRRPSKACVLSAYTRTIQAIS